MLLSTIFSLVASVLPSAHAEVPNQCPQLSGVYKCASDRPNTITVERRDHNGFPDFSLRADSKNMDSTTTSFLVDETNHPFLVDGGAAIGVIGVMNNSCQDNVLNSKIYVEGGRERKELKLLNEVNISAPAPGKLRMEIKGSSGKTSEINCSK